MVAPAADRHATRMKLTANSPAQSCTHCPRALDLCLEKPPLIHYPASMLQGPQGADNRARDPVPETALMEERPENPKPRTRKAAGASVAKHNPERPATQRQKPPLWSGARRPTARPHLLNSNCMQPAHRGSIPRAAPEAQDTDRWLVTWSSAGRSCRSWPCTLEPCRRREARCR